MEKLKKYQKKKLVYSLLLEFTQTYPLLPDKQNLPINAFVKYLGAK